MSIAAIPDRTVRKASVLALDALSCFQEWGLSARRAGKLSQTPTGVWRVEQDACFFKMLEKAGVAGVSRPEYEWVVYLPLIEASYSEKHRLLTITIGSIHIGHGTTKPISLAIQVTSPIVLAGLRERCTLEFRRIEFTDKGKLAAISKKPFAELPVDIINSSAAKKSVLRNILAQQ